MPYIEIDTQSRVPIYEQIMDRVRALVRDGSLSPDSALPSVRQLAADLEINPNTVAKAYGLLEREGLVTTAGRRGTLIAPTAADIARKAVGNRLNKAIDQVIEAADSLGIDRKELVEALKRRSRGGEGQPPKRRSS